MTLAGIGQRIVVFVRGGERAEETNKCPNSVNSVSLR
jgi:hypothetical protein